MAPTGTGSNAQTRTTFIVRSVGWLVILVAPALAMYGAGLMLLAIMIPYALVLGLALVAGAVATFALGLKLARFGGPTGGRPDPDSEDVGIDT